ncbi:YdcF family protein [Granulicella tundricola]|uniref:DUF218 domain-containing protein n=1 Tax=Granulicella tundricola (strain ATCC BAA-1859 / DSM 23138 / MP5ACTX9) TaxID=1198114 RepID=E8X324_GRATM|nr:hypothetical protein [Granulicella tundricola]ADW69248.1 hypothetical protein AciX9_2204 [Granulicella tundricola MP5ACTX9]
MEQHGWTSAEVVSSASHLPRTGLILERYKFGWRTHAAPNPVELSVGRNYFYYAREMAATAVLRWFGFAPTPFLPR